jgi:hypothetical protein
MRTPGYVDLAEVRRLQRTITHSREPFARTRAVTSSTNLVSCINSGDDLGRRRTGRMMVTLSNA